MSRGMAWTIRDGSLELWQGLVLHGMEKVDFHVLNGFLFMFLCGPHGARDHMGVVALVSEPGKNWVFMKT